jgi:hypothetical protein
MRLVALLTTALLSGCATKQFTRPPPLSDAQARLLTCEQIELEIVRNGEVLGANAARQNAVDGQYLTGLLTLGIGNDTEFRSAQRAGVERGRQLENLRDSKGCPRAPAPTR